MRRVLTSRWRVPVCSALAVLMMFGQVLPASAAEFRVFRKTYTRTNALPLAFDTVSVLNPQTTWRLRAVNGDPQNPAIKRMTSANLLVNLSLLLTSSNFNKNVSAVERPVTVRSTNLITNQYNGPLGAQMTVELIGTDNQPPAAAWQQPPAGLMTSASTVTAQLALSDNVAGLDPATLQIRMDGASVRPLFTALSTPALSAILTTVLSPAEGPHLLEAEVKDMAGQPASASVAFTVDQTPPTASVTPPDGAVIDDARPVLTGGYADALAGIDPASVRLILDGADVTAQATVGASEAQMQPSADLADGSHALELRVSDRAGNGAVASSTFTVETVHTPPVTPASGFIHGRVLHGVSGELLPGAVITAEGVTGEIRSGDDGRFVFPVPGTGRFDLNIQMPAFTSVQRRAEVLTTRDAVVDDAYLTPLDPATTLIVAATGGLAVDSTGDFQVEFPAGSAPHDLDVRITPLEHEEQLPGPMPDDFGHIAAVYFEPRFTAFNTPATARHKNRMGLPAGTEVMATQWDEDAQAWMDVGTGRVTPDGVWVEYQIIRFFCWYCFRIAKTLSPQSENPDPEDAPPLGTGSQDPAKGCPQHTGSSICPESGELSQGHSLPSIRTLNQPRVFSLAYRSLAADPSILLGADYDLQTVSQPGDAGTLVPVTTSTVLEIEGRHIEAHVTGAAGKTRHAALWDARNAQDERVPTGAYPYRFVLSNNYQATLGTTGIPADELTPLSTEKDGHAIVVNRVASPFGAGWSVPGLQELRPQPDGTVLVADGDGSATVFRPEPMVDVLVANSLHDSVSFVPGHGDGTFQPAVHLTLPGQPTRVVAADFNEDGLLDAAFSALSLSRVAVLTGREHGFDAPVANNTGTSPQSLAAADVNADGHVDLITANTGSHDLSVLLGQGNGQFATEYRVPVGQRPADVQVADFDGDGRADLAVTNQASASVSVLLGQGNGTFDARPPMAVLREPVGLAAGDFNADGRPDLAVTHVLDDRVSLLMNQGGGTFALGPSLSTGQQPHFVAAADVNEDGMPDLLVTHRVGQVVTLYLSLGNGIFAPRRDLPVSGTGGTLTVADLNQDGHPDVAATGGIQEVSVLLGKGGGAFQRFQRLFVQSAPLGIVAGVFGVAPGRELFSGLPGDFSRLERHPDGSFIRTLKDGTQIMFDAQGHHVATLDRNGNAIQYIYDAAGRLLRVDWPGGHHIAVEYQAGIAPAVVLTDSVNRVTRLELDVAGDLRRIMNPDGSARAFTYDGAHRMLSQTSERGFTTDYVYDVYGRLTDAVLPERQVFDRSTGLLASAREVRRFTPAATQSLINALPAGSGVPENPAAPQPAPRSAFEGPEGQLTRLATDAFGSPTAITDALGRTTLIGRDANGLPLKVTRPNGNAVIMTYDSVGNLLRFREQRDVFTAPQERVFEYEPQFNQVAKATDARRDSIFDSNHPCVNGCVTSFAYDAAGNVISVTDGVGSVTQFAYDSRGLLTTVTDALGTATPAIPDDHQTRFTYDPATGNLLTTTDPLGRLSALAYDGIGNVLRSTDPLLRDTAFMYDAMNRLQSVRDADLGLTAYAYDLAGNLIRVTDAQDRDTVFAYDSLGQLLDTTNPLLETREYAYDLSRNLARVLDAKGQQVLFTYDAANQLLTKTLKDGLGATQDTVSYAYDLLGNLSLVQDGDSRLSFSYDPLGRLIQADSGNPANPALPHVRSNLQYSYNSASGRQSASLSLVGVNNPGGPGFSYVYDGANRLTGLFSQNLFGRSFVYDALGRVQELGGGARMVYQYDAASQLTRLENRLGTNLAETPLDVFQYAYDFAGNRTQLTDRFGPHLYGYDALNRLTQADHPLASGLTDELFTYDSVGNRRTSHLSAAYAYNPANRLLEDDQFAYTYDPNGNLTTKTDKLTLAVTTYTYDVENQLIRIDLPTGQVATYRYDALGRRTEKAVGGAITRYAYEGEDIWSQVDAVRNCATHMYFHGPGIDQPVGFLMDQEGDCNFSTFAGFSEPALVLQTDGLGSVTSLINSTRAFFRSAYLAERVTYDAFGQPTFQNPGPDGRADTADDVFSDHSAFGHPYAFTGREWDPESGLYYYRARYYDPKLGRFLQEDPVGGLLILPQSQHNYAYALNNPVLLTDPNGEAVPLALVMIGVGGLIGGGIEAVNVARSGQDSHAIINAFGVGFISGIAGTAAGLAAGAILHDPRAVGAAAGAGYELGKQLVTVGRHCLNYQAIGKSALTGAILGPLVERLPGLKLVGRRPDIFRPRELANFGPNSARLVGQEAVAGVLGGLADQAGK